MRSVVRAKLQFAALLALVSASQATTYYVDSNTSAGNDSNAGTSTSAPWRTLSKVNAALLQPGDQMLFKRGGVWHGTLTISRSGNSGNAIYFGAYGDTGLAKPAIHGDGSTDATVFVANAASYVTVEGFQVTNFDGSTIFDGSEGLRCGIQIGTWLGNQQNIQILNNEVYNVEGCSNSPDYLARGLSGSVGNNHQYANAGIFGCAKFSSNLLVSGNLVRDSTCTGISIVANREEVGGVPVGQTTGLVIQDNAVNNVGSDGILVVEATGALIQRNSCVGAGNNSGMSARTGTVLGYHGVAVAGIWSMGCTSPVFQYNYCEGTKKVVYDGHAWDFDLETDGTAIYQFNYSRNNEGGFALASLDATSGTLKKIFRYNISVNDGPLQDSDGQGFVTGTADYYNNVFYRTDGQGFKLVNASNSLVKGNFTNNVFYSSGATTHITYQDSAGTDRIFANNSFYGHTPVNPGTNSLTSNPQFVNASGSTALTAGSPFTLTQFRDAVAGFRILGNSPLRNAGTSISGNGGYDFWATALYNGVADIGANETLQGPYGGTAASMPGTVEAENFDNGGEGIAYHDVDAANNGGQYRTTEGPDIQTHPGTGTYDIGYVQPGEWLSYTVNVTATASYDISFRVAGDGSGGTFHLEVDGVDKTGTMTMPNTGGWQTFTFLTKSNVALTSGSHVLKVVFDGWGSAGVLNLDSITLAASAIPAPTFSVATGTYTSTQNVTISSSVSGTTIRYTTNGTTPTSTTGTVYSSPVSISSSATLKAVAYNSLTTGSVASAAYVINSSFTGVTNGGFESGSSGWTIASTNGTPAAAAPLGYEGTSEGSQAMVFGSSDVAGNATVSQTITTTSGGKYAVLFDFGAFGASGQAQALRVQALNGSTVLSTRDVQAYGPGTYVGGDVVFSSYAVFFTATSSSTIIRFTDLTTLTNSNGCDGVLDRVIGSVVGTVTNGSFETGSTSSWTMTSSNGSAAAVQVLTYQGHSNGSHAAAFGGSNVAGNAVVSQAITTISGTHYAIPFDLGAFGASGQPQQMRVQALNGSTVLATLDISATGPGTYSGGDVVFTTYVIDFPAASSSTTLRFTDLTTSTNSNGCDGILDFVGGN